MSDRAQQDSWRRKLAMEEILDAFESAWRDKTAPDWRAHLPSDPGLRTRVGPELLWIDWERRREHGALPSLDDYADAPAEWRFSLAERVHAHRSDSRFSTRPLSALGPRDSSSSSHTLSSSGSQENKPLPVGPRTEPAAIPSGQLSESFRIGRYRVDRLLGEGGFGRVYLAFDEALNRQVAIKLPHSSRIATEADAAPYLEEARAAAALDHPRIVPVYDVGSTAEFPLFVVAKYIDGCDLTKRLRTAPLTVLESIRLVATIAEALHAAHTRGIIHRDVKPGNILIDRTEVPYLADFGLALNERYAGRGPRYVGTPSYMSPEQARGEGHRVDPRSDVFSLGIVLFELLTGRRPFEAATDEELLRQIASTEAQPPRRYRESISRELDRICLRALAKRRSDRFSTAQDFADDLHDILESHGNLAGNLTAPLPGGVSRGRMPLPVTRETAARPPDRAGGTRDSISADGAIPRIVPKGLRSFDIHDAEFFLDLVPGPRDRSGLPEAIRFWKNRIEERDPDQTFPVGLLYGPSGSGKTSLIRAGLLPNLSKDIEVIYVEATASDTENRLRTKLRRRFSGLPDQFSLQDSLCRLRLGAPLEQGSKLLIIVDQFEQWLQARQASDHSELIQALHQCDGGRVQCLLTIRDDFWMAATRVLRRVEVELADGHNSAAVDRFSRDHARKLLIAYGLAFDKLPADAAELTSQQAEFVTQAVRGLEEEGSVVSVRLALFAETMRHRDWTIASLRSVGGVAGAVSTFLEETFCGRLSKPERRYHEKAVKAVLASLLPATETSIRRQRRSADELKRIAGYVDRPRDFLDLMRILDSELRLVTPCDPDGGVGDEHPETGIGDERLDAADELARYYQLSHDYLVETLREWFGRLQRETRKGRTQLRLTELSTFWQAKCESRFLPSTVELCNILWFVPAGDRSALQQQMLGQAIRHHALRYGGLLLVALALLLAVGRTIEQERQASLERQVSLAVDAIEASRGAGVGPILHMLRGLPPQRVIQTIRNRHPSGTDDKDLGLFYALAELGAVDVNSLCARIERVAADELDNLARALQSKPSAALVRLVAMAEEAEANRNWAYKARLAIVSLQLGESTLAADMCQIADRPDPVQRTVFIDTLANWHGNTSSLQRLVTEQRDPGLVSGIVLAVGSLADGRLTPEQRLEWERLVQDLHVNRPDGATHSATEWCLRKWRVARPRPQRPAPGDDEVDWRVNGLGMTMLRLKLPAYTSEVEIELCSQEVTVGQFDMFIRDPDCQDIDKPRGWQGYDTRYSTTREHPVQQVNWFDAALFCNWLSRRENLVPCYIPTRADGTRQQTYDSWTIVAEANGYRLPTQAEWEYACRAGTTTRFHFGDDEIYLARYGVVLAETSGPCGSRLPSGWGYFDMHGNVYEWCNDAVGELQDGKPIHRADRGGAWCFAAINAYSGATDSKFPDTRQIYLGFRVARGPMSGR